MLSIKSNKNNKLLAYYITLVPFISSPSCCVKYYRVSKISSRLCTTLYYATFYVYLPRYLSPSGFLNLNRRVGGPQSVCTFWSREKSVTPAGIRTPNGPARILTIILYHFNSILTSTPRFPKWPLPSCFRKNIL